MRKLSFFLVALSALALYVLASGCGNQHGSSFGDDEGGLGDGSPIGDETPQFGGDGGGGEGGGCALSCSADLHDVVDCNNNVVTHCPPDQGCGGATCVDACQAATANKSTFGCDYYAVDPDIIPEADGACFAAYVANTWGTPVTLTADWGGMPLSVANAARVPSGTGQSITYKPLTGGNQLQPGEVAIVFLNYAGFVACPGGITPGLTGVDGATHGTGIGKAFHITSNRPVVAYDIFPYGGGSSAATSATLLIPSSAWDTNYIAVNAFAKDQVVGFAQPFLEVVAAQDGTNVKISPTAAIVGGAGVAPTGKGMPQTYTLNKGQYLQITQDAELTGSPILADKPVGVWGGATCLNIDVNDVACDSAHQQLFPVSTLGHEYLAVRYRNRYQGNEEIVPWRIVGAADGTALTYEPSPPMGAPLTINQRQVLTFWSAGPFVVKSQDDMHPFYLAAHMTGADSMYSGGSSGRGDPEWVNVLPPQEYLKQYVFFTDPTYPETNLVLTRQKAGSGFADVFLDCTGTTAIGGWQPMGSSGNYEYTRIDLVTGDFQKNGMCDNGRHEIHSDVPFGLTVWGWGSELSSFPSTYVSYAYPAGASVKPINTVIVPPDPR